MRKLLLVLVLCTSLMSKAQKSDSIPLPLGLTETGAIKLIDSCLRMVCHYEKVGTKLRKVIEVTTSISEIKEIIFRSNLVDEKIDPIKVGSKEKKELEVMSGTIDGESIVFTIEVQGFSVKAAKTTVHQFPALEAYMTRLLLETDEGVFPHK